MQESKDVEPLPGTVGEPKTALEYPIRALVLSSDYEGAFKGREIWVRKGKYPRSGGSPPTYNGFDYDDLFYSQKDDLIRDDYTWRPDELKILPAPTTPASEPPEGPAVDLVEAAEAFYKAILPNDDPEFEGYKSLQFNEGVRRAAIALKVALASSRVSGRTSNG